MPEPLNCLTARPTLELLLALAEFEVPDVTPDKALPVFVDFLTLEQTPGTIDVGFQTEIVDEVPSEGLLTLILGVRFPLSSDYPDPDLESLYRSVGIRHLNAFMDAVRETAEWREGQRAQVWQCTAFGEDD